MKIMIADDHVMVREGLQLLLRDAYPSGEIDCVSDSVDLLKSCLKNSYDLILCDISIPPGDSGLDSVKRIHQFAPLPKH